MSTETGRTADANADADWSGARITVEVPFHLQRLAHCGSELSLELAAPYTQRALIAALERAYPPLAGAVIDPHTGARRPLLRFFACQQDQTFLGLDALLPEAVLQGREPFLIVGAISGGLIRGLEPGLTKKCLRHSDYMCNPCFTM